MFYFNSRNQENIKLALRKQEIKKVENFNYLGSATANMHKRRSAYCGEDKSRLAEVERVQRCVK